MDVTMMLCDYAEAINGKLYISGGNWNILRGPLPIDCSVAVAIAVPWQATNRPHRLALDLLNEDGGPVVGPDGNPIHIEGDFEVGRPPGTKAGDSIVNSLAFRIQGLAIPTGGYSFVMQIDGSEVAKTPFRVFRPENYEQEQQ